jgi:hypothetical protein
VKETLRLFIKNKNKMEELKEVLHLLEGSWDQKDPSKLSRTSAQL